MEVCIKQSFVYSWLGERQRYDWNSNSFFISIQSRNTLRHILLMVAELGRAQQHKSMGCSDEVFGRKLVPLSTAWQDYALSLQPPISVYKPQTRSTVHRSLSYYFCLKKKGLGEFPGSPVVRTQCFYWGGLGSIPGWGIKIPRATGHS